MGGGGGVGQVIKRIPRIKFPQRHHKPTPSTSPGLPHPLFILFLCTYGVIYILFNIILYLCFAAL